MPSTTHLINFPTDFTQQILETSKIVFRMLSPILVPIIGVGLFVIVALLILSRIINPAYAGAAKTGWATRVIEKKKLLYLLLLAVGAFLIWLTLQPQEFQQGLMLPLQLLATIITSNAALLTLAITLFGITVAAFFL